MVEPPTPTPGMQRSMTLVMPLADPSQAGIIALAQTVFGPGRDALTVALDDSGTVHFARFVIVAGNLVMASAYDGDFGDYIQMFIHRIGDVFNAIMGFVVDPAATPVQQHPGAFVRWVAERDQPSIGFYSGYEGFTTQQIRYALQLPLNDQPSSPGREPSAVALTPEALDDMQGLILRGYGHSLARHFFLQVLDAAKARVVLGAMASASHQPNELRVTPGTPWGNKQPDACWAVGLTAGGLRALGVPVASLQSFPSEFLAGATNRASRVGDVGPNSPQYWLEGLTDDQAVHLVVSLYTGSAEAQDRATVAFRAASASAFADVAEPFDGAEFPDTLGWVHFGYRDNLSQPTISGDPLPRPRDDQPLSPAGEFVLGYESQYSGVRLDVPQPVELGKNGSFSAFRILEQQVAEFEDFLETSGTTTGLGTETIAAKVVGRWRNGLPLLLSPDTDSPPIPVPESSWNDFSYGTDADGVRCPIGAHIRRSNPRDQRMRPTGDGHQRRLMRRAMPFGARWNPGDSPDGISRGLVGHFIGASLLLQFETLMGEWLNIGMTEPRITGSDDILLGADPARSKLIIPSADGSSTQVAGFGPFVTTRAGIYLFLPSLTALRWIGNL